MAEKLEDLNLPSTTVYRIIKEAVPDSVIVGKDVKAAIGKAASMFILYITSQATVLAQKAGRKTLTAKDICEAIEEAEFGELLEALQEVLKESKERKKGDDTSKTDLTETNEDTDEEK